MKPLIAALLMPAWLAACTAPPAPPSVPVSLDPRVVVVPGLPVMAEAPQESLQAGMLRVTLRLTNATGHDLPVLATTDWLDVQGRPIRSLLSRPQRLTVPRFGDTVVDSIAPRAAATGFRIRIEPDQTAS